MLWEEMAKNRLEEYERLGDNDLNGLQAKQDYKRYMERATTCRVASREDKKEVERLRAELKSSFDRFSELKEGSTDKEWKQIYDLCIERDTVPESSYSELDKTHKILIANGVKYINSVKYAKQPSEDDIIKKVGGPDKTGGSCASLALAYIANKSGFKVLDFRGGTSKSIFASECAKIAEKLGCDKYTSPDMFHSANKVLEGVEDGKEYYFDAGKHAAIVRKKEGKLQYLELQSPTNGWYDLNDNVLKNRFGCAHSKARFGTTVLQTSRLIETSKLASNEEFISLMGYINTDREKQKKGEGGGIK